MIGNVFGKTMKHGTFRNYLKIPFTSLGIKVARLNFNKQQMDSTVCVFLSGIIMNLLEYKRYRYYSLGKRYVVFGKKQNIFQFRECTSLADFLNPVYFTCGLFSIVKHQSIFATSEQCNELRESDFKHKVARFCCEGDIKNANIAVDKGHYVFIDYGEFQTNCAYNSQFVGNNDYA